jgi:hypothetical protein
MAASQSAKSERSNNDNDSTNVDQQTRQETGEAPSDSLPPQDGGSGAWLFLFGACVFEIVSWGK